MSAMCREPPPVRKNSTPITPPAASAISTRGAAGLRRPMIRCVCCPHRERSNQCRSGRPWAAPFQQQAGAFLRTALTGSIAAADSSDTQNSRPLSRRATFAVLEEYGTGAEHTLLRH
jgi:hypothetical protein